MVLKSKEDLFGARAFAFGVILAIVAGIFSVFFGHLSPIVLSFLVILGVAVGFLNFSDKDINTFLIAAVSLVIVSFAGIQGTSSLVSFKFAEVELIGIEVGKIITSILGALLMLLIPATIIVAIKSLFSVARR